jgi:hypothetical protein
VLPIKHQEPEVRYRNSTLTPEDVQRRMTQAEQYLCKAKPPLDSDLSHTTQAA